MRHLVLCLFAATIAATTSSAGAADEIVIADFEGKDYSPWKVEGAAFGTAPVRDEALKKWRITGFEGQGVAGSAVGDGKAVGTLTSPAFRIERKYINFLLAGGSNQAELHVDLLVDGKVVRTATGANRSSMTRTGFDVAEFRGKAARLRIVDNCVRGKSTNYSIHVDQIEMSDVPAGGVAREEFSLVSRVGGAGPPVPARDVVHALGGRLEGELELTAKGLRIGGRAVASADLVYAARRAVSRSDPRRTTSTTPHVIRLRTGETWRVAVTAFELQKLTVRGGLVGDRTLDAKTLAAVELRPDDRSADMQPETLYCTTSEEPIPGKMLWIRSNEVAIACPLGVVRLPLTGMIRYVFPSGTVVPPLAAGDEIGLIDGSRFRGRITSIGETIELAHPILEKVSVPGQLVQYVLRSHERVAWLARLPHEVTRGVGPTADPPGPRTIDCRTISDMSRKVPGLWSIRMQPQTTVRYRMGPRPGGGKATFRAILAPQAGNRGRVRVRLSVSGRRLVEEVLAPGGAAVPLVLDLPAGDRLDLSVDFAGRLAYPCTVEWRDARVVMAPADKSKGARK